MQVSQILSQLRPDRQTLLFSATLSERLEVACGSWLKAPVRIYADQRAADGGSRGDESTTEAAEVEAGAGEEARLPKTQPNSSRFVN